MFSFFHSFFSHIFSDLDSILASFWLHFHWNVLCVHLFLELQVLLCLRIHVPRGGYALYCLRMCRDCDYVLPPQRGGLQLAVAFLPLRLLHFLICLSLCGVFLFHQDKDAWIFPDQLLLWLCYCLQCFTFPDLWFHRLRDSRHVCAPHLPGHQMRLIYRDCRFWTYVLACNCSRKPNLAPAA